MRSTMDTFPFGLQMRTLVGGGTECLFPLSVRLSVHVRAPHLSTISSSSYYTLITCMGSHAIQVYCTQAQRFGFFSIRLCPLNVRDKNIGAFCTVHARGVLVDTVLYIFGIHEKLIVGCRFQFQYTFFIFHPMWWHAFIDCSKYPQKLHIYFFDILYLAFFQLQIEILLKPLFVQ